MRLSCGKGVMYIIPKKKMDGTVIVRATGRPLFGRAA